MNKHATMRLHRQPRVMDVFGHNTRGTSIALSNTARAWWQSRHRLVDPPELVDLIELAKHIRRKGN